MHRRLRQLLSSDARSHLRWRMRRFRADLADRTGRAFCYAHPLLGRFVYHPRDVLSRRILLYGGFEEPELRFAMAHAAAGGVIVDVGANIGLYAAACARAASRRGRVIAFEPAPATFEKLELTLRRLHIDNVTAHRMAIGAEAGAARFLRSLNGRDAQQRMARSAVDEGFDLITVPVGRLDDLCGDEATAVRLLKLDIEGHEIGALRGARRILSNGRVHLIVEFYPEALIEAGTSIRELWDCLGETHRCTAVIRQDGSRRPPALDELVPRHRQETFNTLWIPRADAVEGRDREHRA